MTTTDPRPAIEDAAPFVEPLAGSDPLGGHGTDALQSPLAAEGQDSPQAMNHTAPMSNSPAGNLTAPPANGFAAPMDESLEGRTPSHGQGSGDTHGGNAVADDIPSGHVRNGAQSEIAAGDSAGQPAASVHAMPSRASLLADPLLTLAADVLFDLEKVRIANENRLRQLTRSEEDSDGETRGFGLDEAHPDVARLAALVGMLVQAEHQATLNLGRLMRQHPLGPWMAAQRGIGPKQGPRLLAATGDPYIRPEITGSDGTVESPRPRTVSELWAFCGYHVIRTPVSGHRKHDPQGLVAADGPGFPADHSGIEAQGKNVGGELNGHPGHSTDGNHRSTAGVAPKRARGQKANWSAAAKMRAYLVAESCMKQPSGTPYRDAYEAARAKYAEAVHGVECVRCGPKGKPAQPGSPLSDGHKHARALRIVAKEVLRNLWREAKRLHETSP